jgi:drug/metabolite transporter (DMT)-like permease
MPVPRELPPDNLVLRASLASVGSAALFGVMSWGVRALDGRLPAAEVASVRFAAGLLVVLAALASGRARLRPRRWGWLACRGLAGGLAVQAYFASIAHVGVGVATLLNQTMPVFSMLLSWALLGERPRRRALVALALALAGVVLVVGHAGSLALGGWQGVGLLSALASGLAVTSIRAVRRHDASGAGAGSSESALTVFASFTGLGFVVALPGAVAGWVAPDGHQWALLLFVAATSIVAQLVMTGALAHVTALASGTIHQLTVVTAMAGGVALFGERLEPGEALGCLLTMTGVAWSVVAGTRPALARAPQRR